MKSSSCKFGIIGGAGPLASSLLYQSILTQCYSEDIIHIPEIILLNFPFSRGLTKEESTRHHNDLQSELQHCVDTLFNYGVNIAGMACNTLHHFLKEVDLKGINFIHMPQKVMKKIHTQEIHRILVLGTQTTAAKQIYCQASMKVIPLNEENQLMVDAIINRVIQGKIYQSDVMALSDLIFCMVLKHKIEGVVLGCTELSVLNHKYPLQAPSVLIFDSIKILAQSFLEKIKETL